MEYASNGKANAALTTGIIGTAGFGAQLLGNLLGGWGMAPAAMCSENTPVTRYTLDQQNTISEKNMEIAYWRGQDETNRKISESYSKLENRLIGLAAEVRANKDEQVAINMQQAVYNGTNTATISCIQNQVNQLLGLTKLVVPNASVCPGWGAAKVTVEPATATT
jgi:hypothetical protein|nr:MAG TPA: hypothetical protein [Caudoviricetes sp.]